MYSNLDSVAFTGDYNDLQNLPDLNILDQMDTLSNYVMNDALLSLVSSLSLVALSNDYIDLDNLPDLSIYSTKDTLSNFVILDSLGTTALTNNYEDLDNLPDPDVLAEEIVENIESGLNSFKEIMLSINANAE